MASTMGMPCSRRPWAKLAVSLAATPPWQVASTTRGRVFWGGTEGAGQVFSGDLPGLAVLGLQLHEAGGTVAGEMEHVIAPVEEGGLDLVRMADLQDLHLGVAVDAGSIHGVEDGLQLGFDVQNDIVGLAFVGSADGDEDAKRARKRTGGAGPGSEEAAQHTHAEL